MTSASGVVGKSISSMVGGVEGRAPAAPVVRPIAGGIRANRKRDGVAECPRLGDLPRTIPMTGVQPTGGRAGFCETVKYRNAWHTAETWRFAFSDPSDLSVANRRPSGFLRDRQKEMALKS